MREPIMTPSLSPELQLAAACAMWPPSDCRSGAILTAAAETLDWPRFLRVVRRHQVVGLVHEGLNRQKWTCRPRAPAKLVPRPRCWFTRISP
jgi:hypothetical protein